MPDKVSAVTVNKVCGSGLKAVMMAAQRVQLGDTEIPPHFIVFVLAELDRAQGGEILRVAGHLDQVLRL